MAQTPSRGNTTIPKQNLSPPEDDVPLKIQDKPPSQGTIAIVKSKIREKDAPRQEEDPLESARASPRQKLMKRGSSTDNFANEMVAVKKSTIKPEINDSKPEEVEDKHESESKPEEKITPVVEAKSKKSLAQIRMSKKSLIPKEDEQSTDVAVKKSEMKAPLESATSNFTTLNMGVLPSQEPQEQKSEKTEKTDRFEKIERPEKPEMPNALRTIPNSYTENSLRKTYPKNYSFTRHMERKNYMANVSPEPLDEYPADEDQQAKESKEQKVPEKKTESDS